jgi:hypothetical protein
MRTLGVIVVVCLIFTVPAAAKRMHLRRPPHGGFQMRMTPFPIPVGGEREVCEYQITPNRKPMDVAEMQLRSTPGTHHFVLWEYLGADRNAVDFWSGPKDSPGCVGLGPQDGFFTTADLFGMQVSPSQVKFPPGVAVHLEPHAIVYSNLHLKNFFSEPIMAEAVFNVIPAKKGTVKHHAQTLTVGSWDIDIPPVGSASLTGEWRPPVPLNIVQLSTHQHAGLRASDGRRRQRHGGAGRFARLGACVGSLVPAGPAHRGGRGLPLHVRLDQPGRPPRALRCHHRRRDVLHDGVLLPR